MYYKNEEQELQKEENLYLLQRFLTMTQNGSMTWYCTYFAPVSFVLSERDDGSPDAFLSQLYTVKTTWNGIGWELSFAETIKIPSGQSTVHVMGEPIDRPARRFEIQHITETEISSGTDVTEQQRYQNPLAAQLAGEVLAQIENSDTVQDAYSWAEYNVMKNVPRQYFHQPLYKMGKKLLENKQPMVYHKCVVDGEYRQSMLQKQ